MPSAALLLVFAGAAWGARCDKIDYAEAKDWPVEELETTYCRYIHEAEAASAEQQAIYAIRHDPDTPAYRALYREAQACYEAASALGRVIKNVHRRPYPTCNKP